MTYDQLMQFIEAEDHRLRKRYGDLTNDNSWHLSQMVKLMEEMGELSEQILAYQSLQRRDKTKKFNHTALSEEVADVLIVTMLIGHKLGVNITDALEQKIKKIEARY